MGAERRRIPLQSVKRRQVSSGHWVRCAERQCAPRPVVSMLGIATCACALHAEACKEEEQAVGMGLARRESKSRTFVELQHGRSRRPSVTLRIVKCIRYCRPSTSRRDSGPAGPAWSEVKEIISCPFRSTARFLTTQGGAADGVRPQHHAVGDVDLLRATARPRSQLILPTIRPCRPGGMVVSAQSGRSRARCSGGQALKKWASGALRQVPLRLRREIVVVAAIP